MPENDDPTKGSGSGGTGDNGGGGDNKGDPPDPKGGGSGSAGSEWSEDRARATIERQRESEREAKAAQKRAEDELAEFRKGLPEKERLERENAELKARNDTATQSAQKIALRGEVSAIATTMNFRNPRIAMKFIDASKVEWSDDGEPTGIRTQLEAAIKEDPYLVGAKGTGDAGDGGDGSTGGKTMTDMIHEAAGR